MGGTRRTAGRILGLATVLAACTPSSPPPTPGPDPLPHVGPVPAEPVADLGGGAPNCPPVEGPDPRTVDTADVTRTSLEPAVQWRAKVDARGGYAHAVAFDPDGGVVWAHDTANLRFAVDRFDASGRPVASTPLRPRALEPKALAVSEAGEILVGGTSFAAGRDGGDQIVQLGGGAEPDWRRPTPRVGARQLLPRPDGATLLLGWSGRREVTLGGHRMANEWLPPGHSMDVVARLSPDGDFEWSRAFFPGALAMAAHDDALYLAGNFGDEAVDYGAGPATGPGVLARLDAATGAHVWSRSFDVGLRAVVPHGDDMLVVGFGSASLGGPVVEGVPAAWIDGDGCYRGSASLGTGLSRITAAPDGSLVIYGFAPVAPARHAISETAFDVPGGHWFVAGLSAELRLRWLHTVACDGLEVAAGPDGRAALSCYRDLSRPGRLQRRYELIVRAPM